MKIIIYGAGGYGRWAYWEYMDKTEIISFVDKNKSLWGGCAEGTNIPVASPEILHQYVDVPVVIAVARKDGIREQLRQYGDRPLIDYEPLDLQGGMPAYVRAKQQRLNDQLLRELSHRTIILGEFLEDGIRIPELSFAPGGSGLLDYAFIVTCLKRFGCKKYAEIGTYIGDSINLAADYCDECYSITASEESPYHMKEWCRMRNLPDFSNRMVYKKNIRQFPCMDNRTFDFSKLPRDIDLYFIDGDHSYEGIWYDTKHVFEHRKTNSIVIWHDVKYSNGCVAALAIKTVLGEKFKNVFVTDNNMCAIYLPPKYQEQLHAVHFGYTEERQALYAYDIKLHIQKRR